MTSRTDSEHLIREIREENNYTRLAISLAMPILVVTAVSIGVSRTGAGPEAILVGRVIGILAVSCVALAFVQFRRSETLVQTDKSIKIRRGTLETEIPYSNLLGVAVNQTENDRDGVYLNTTFEFEFVDDSGRKTEYSTDVLYNSHRYKELQQFQSTVNQIVADQMIYTLRSEGCVEWTERMTLMPGYFEFKATPQSEYQEIKFTRVSDWYVDQGALGVSLDGRRIPQIVEDTTCVNFFPGLIIWEEMLDHASSFSEHVREPAKKQNSDIRSIEKVSLS